MSPQKKQMDIRNVIKRKILSLIAGLIVGGFIILIVTIFLSKINQADYIFSFLDKDIQEVFLNASITIFGFSLTIATVFGVGMTYSTKKISTENIITGFLTDVCVTSISSISVFIVSFICIIFFQATHLWVAIIIVTIEILLACSTIIFFCKLSKFTLLSIIANITSMNIEKDKADKEREAQIIYQDRIVDLLEKILDKK